jgi:hypothetical protein
MNDFEPSQPFLELAIHTFLQNVILIRRSSYLLLIGSSKVKFLSLFNTSVYKIVHNC